MPIARAVADWLPPCFEYSATTISVVTHWSFDFAIASPLLVFYYISIARLVLGHSSDILVHVHQYSILVLQRGLHRRETIRCHLMYMFLDLRGSFTCFGIPSRYLPRCGYDKWQM